MLSILLFSFFAIADEGLVPVDFETKITTCLSRELIWEQLEVSMVDSEEGWLWPNADSRVKGAGMTEEAKIMVTYDTFFSDPTYAYILSDISPLESFTYTAVEDEHPFEGGATISLSTDQNGESILSWKGKYLSQPGDWVMRRFFNSFSRRFFEGLSENIKSQESSCNKEAR